MFMIPCYLTACSLDDLSWTLHGSTDAIAPILLAGGLKRCRPPASCTPSHLSPSLLAADQREFMDRCV
jgi:hypothetical protein